MMPRLDADNVTVVMVAYNSAHCLPGLSAGLQTMHKIIVVDNASDDDLQTQLPLTLPQASLLRNDRNLGFGTANNRALAQVKTPYALLLNPDCLPTKEFLDGLLQAAADFPDAAIVAPHLIRRNGTPEVSYRWPATHWVSRGPKADGPCHALEHGCDEAHWFF
jgi:GT2 family glycosyltransferase